MVNRITLLLFIGLVFTQDISIAVMEFETNGVSQDEARTLTDRLRNELTATGLYSVMERNFMEEIIKEQGLQQSGICNSNECVVEIGKIIGAQNMVSGSIGKVGDIFSISARIIDVETSKIIEAATYDHKGDIGILLIKGMREVTLQLTTGQFSTSNSQKEISNNMLNIDNTLGRYEIAERYPRGQKKIVRLYTGTGLEEKVQVLGYREDGKLIYREDPTKDNTFYIFYHNNGNKKGEGNFKGNISQKLWHGLWTYWYENGQKSYEKNYINGLDDGTHLSWYENGQKKFVKNYNGAYYDGLWTHWYENGQKKKEYSYNKGILDGLSIEWYPHGQKKVLGNYLNTGAYKAIKHGTWIQWWGDGQKRSETFYFKDSLNGMYYQWYEDGTLQMTVTYLKGVEKELVTYHGNGNKMMEKVIYNKNGETVWQYVDYDEKGQQRMKGKWELIHYPRKILGSSKKGFRNGKFQFFDGSGELLEEHNYKNGMKHGLFREKLENGSWFLYKYKRGKRVIDNTLMKKNDPLLKEDVRSLFF